MTQIWPVIASRERAQELVAQLGRLQGQLRGEERVVVVVDGDPATVDALAGVDAARVKLIALAERLGVDDARRAGNAFVPADAVVCEVDDHDPVEPDLLAELRGVFDRPDTMIAYCDVWHSDPEGRVKKLREKKGGRPCTAGNVGWGMRAYRKWLYDMVDGYPSEYFPANDYALLCMMEQLAGGDGALVHIRKPLVTVIEDHASISGQHRAEQQRQVRRIAGMGLTKAFSLPYRLLGSADGTMPATQSPPGRAPGPELRNDRRAPVVQVTVPGRAPGPELRKRPIPKVIHFVWVGPPMPDWAHTNVNRFRELNPNYTVLVHDESVLLDRFRAGYEAIAGEHVWARKSDLLRVSALVRFGGWYFDTDFLALRPLSDLYDRYANFPAGCFLTRHHELVANGVIGVALNCDYFQRLVDELTRLCREPKNRAWDAYGPRPYTNLADCMPSSVQMGPAEMFYPIAGPRDAQRCYAQLDAAGFSSDAIARAFPGVEVPYMLHMAMEGRLDLAPAVNGESRGLEATCSPEGSVP